MAQLTRLPEEEAVQRYFDAGNWSVLRWGLAFLLPSTFFGVIGALVEGWQDLAPLWGFAFLINVVLVFGRRRRFVTEHARQFLIAFILIHMVACVFSMPRAEPEPAYVFAGYLFPAGLMVFRMSWFEYLFLDLVCLGAAAWFASRPEMANSTGALIGLLVGVLAWLLFTGGMSIRLTRRRRRSFLVDWRREVARDREEARMRGELLDAREIQLSMLPRATPELDWVDASGLSIPASEVGGDYYEYFQLDADRLAVIIGDVAGHGVASGLVLSGVRSGLHLLHDELERPVEVVERLNRMVRETAPSRMFVTLQVALVDRRKATVTMANAGHPPMLYLAAGEEVVREVGPSGLPLGTRLDPSFQEATQPLAAGDVLVLFTDGVIEAENLSGEAFGDQRLLAEAAKASALPSARQIRDALVAAVSRFKGDAVQVDDQTLVVLRLGELDNQQTRSLGR
jgi:hypothetical protein